MADQYPASYDGTLGFTGVDTSRESAEDERDNGTATKRIRTAVASVGHQRASGMTVKEFRESVGWHHGKASAALTNAHQGGWLVRLKEKRLKAHVYVTPEFVGERETLPFSVPLRKVKADPEEVAKAMLRVWAQTHSHEEAGKAALREMGLEAI